MNGAEWRAQREAMPLRLIYNEGGKSIQWRKDSLFSKCAGKTEQLHIKERNTIL